MQLLMMLTAALGAAALAGAVWLVRRVKRQIGEMAEALADVKSGNGNRRILLPDNELAAPLAYEINDIIAGYESRLTVLRRADEANKQLMTSLSHDVRTPLTTLLGYLDAVHKGVVQGGERDAYIETARRKAHDLKEYIDVLFDWFKLNSGEFAVTPARVEAAELTRDILIDWIPLFEEHGIRYRIEIPDRPFYARLDSEGYRRILNNLIQNVLTHSRADEIEVSLAQRAQGVEVTVRDNGVGMEPQDLAHIFERLYKCDKARAQKGSGLGLSIVQQLTRRMGGQVSVESAPGQGTAFTLLFAPAE